jgi:hypothetical protein
MHRYSVHKWTRARSAFIMACTYAAFDTSACMAGCMFSSCLGTSGPALRTTACTAPAAVNHHVSLALALLLLSSLSSLVWTAFFVLPPGRHEEEPRPGRWPKSIHRRMERVADLTRRERRCRICGPVAASPVSASCTGESSGLNQLSCCASTIQ